MHLIHSIIRIANANQSPSGDEEHQHPYPELVLRYEAYKKTCDKYRHEIAAIQKYLPGWVPEFR